MGGEIPRNRQISIAVLTARLAEKWHNFRMKTMRWIFPTEPPSRDLAAYPSLLAKVLHTRGLRDYWAAERFLSGPSCLSDPYSMLGINKAVQRIKQAIRDKELVIVYGDFDADGVTSTLVLTETLLALGAKVQPYIPDRHGEGYGLHVGALKMLRRQGANLIITVDNGIRSIAEVRAARRIGLSVIVCDHHEPGEALPEAEIVINPKQSGDTYADSMLAGVGVTYRLSEALLNEAHVPWLEAGDLLQLVALGTIADMVPLNTPENRYLARAGLQQMRHAPRPGIQALLREAGTDRELIDAETVSFAISPRLNAAGRMAHAALAYRLLATCDETEAFMLAAQLDELNSIRRKATAEAAAYAETLLEGIDGTILVADPTFEPGIIGLVAAQLARIHGRPAFVVQIGEAEAHGSARSHSSAFSVVAALSSCHDLLTRYGGHAGAAGFALPASNLPALRERLSELSAGTIERPALRIDAVVGPEEITLENAEALAAFDPVGMGNPAPILCVKGLKLVEARTIGSDSSHLAFRLATDDGEILDAVGFGLARRQSELPERIDLAFRLAKHVWRGRVQAQLQVIDFENGGNE